MLVRTLICLAFGVLGLGGATRVAAQTFPAVPAAPPAALRDAALRDWLRQNWYDGKRTVLSYATARARLYNYVDNQQGQVRCVYSGYTEAKPLSFTSTSTSMQNINCEHTVPQAWFNEVERMRSDLHHLFPTVAQWNADRGSDPFAEIPDAQTSKWIRGLSSQTTTPSTNLPEWSEDTNTAFEPRDDHKGNLARAVLYFYTVHANQTFDAGKGTVAAVGNLNTLYQWHLQDPVDAQEQLRNRRAAASQGNYNPYITDPALVARAWGFQGTGITPTVQFAAASGTHPEGNAGTSTYTVTVTLTAEPTATATVQVALSAAGTTATTPADYTFSTPQTLTFGPGLPLARTVTVTVVGEAVVEPDETVRLALQNPTGPLSLGSTLAHTLTIANDDVAPSTSTLAFAAASGTFPEGNVPATPTTYTVNLTLAPAATAPVTVAVTVDAANTSADATDYTLATTTVTFSTGQTTRPVQVTVRGDVVVEPDKVLTLRLGTPTGAATLGAVSTHSLTLRNDDAPAGGELLTCGGLLFSEYIESTSGSNKAVEVYNPSDEAVSLAGYQVRVFNNGATTANATLNLAGTLGGREVYVIINSLSTDPNFLDQGNAVSSVTNFNGDDALALSYNGTVIDVIGVIGQDPGTAWSIPSGGATANYTLIRNPSSKRGQADWSLAAAEWTAVGVDYYDDLGVQNAAECRDPLPVSLTHFEVRRTGPATAEARWTTAQEIRNAYFEVEKSADGRTFAPCGRVAGRGTTATAHTYHLTDTAAAAAGYYRLRQLDFDGTATHSPVVYVKAGPGPRVTLYPTVTTGAVTLSGLPPATPLTLAVRTAYGQVLVPARATTAAAASDHLRTALTAAAPGVYFISVSTADGQQFLKVVKPGNQP